jgi:uncharacterized protein (DUF1800 family)
MNLLALREQLSLSAYAATSADDTPLTVPDALVHFMNRTSFGIRQAEYQAAAAMGYEAFVEAQLKPNPGAASTVETAIKAALPSVNMTGAQLYAAYPPADNQDFVALSELRAATLLRQLYSPNQLFEVMVEFWTDHFSIEHIHGFDRIAKTIDDQDIRRNAMGKFKDLLNASARSPAMLFYLDNYVNVKNGAQENYARELLELHTLGVDGGYGEVDVKNVARAFTGWSFNRTQISFVFNARNHDTDAKAVLELELGKNRGIEDGQDVLNMLAAHPSTAKFIASKLVRRFVSDAPPENLVAKVQAEFLKTQGDVTSMLRVIFNSIEFAASADLKVKRPQEYVQSLLRVSDAKLTGNTYIRALNNVYEGLGQVWSNWAAPNGYPDVASYWINSTAWLGRWNFVFAAVEGRLDRGITIDLNALAGGAKSADALIDRLSERLLRRKLSQTDRAALLASTADGSASNVELRGDVLVSRTRELSALLLSSRYFNYR